MALMRKKGSKSIMVLTKPIRFLWLPVLILVSLLAHATPEQDLAELRNYYRQRFPNLKLNDYSNGVYAIDPVARRSWSAIEEFPPYDEAVEAGKKLFEAPFPGGGKYADCFPDKGLGITHHYPLWNKKSGEVVTLPLAINDCRLRHHASKLEYDKPEMIHLTAYMVYTTRGKPISVEIPKDDPRAITAYERGKAFYYQRHGQLNFACATCHIRNAGKKLRAEILGASIGHTNNWPTYRLKWGEIGSLHRRFSECLTQIKAQPFAEQSEEYRNLEFFLSYLGNGVPITGPSTRK